MKETNTAVCIVVKDNLNEASLVIENLLAKTQASFTLYIMDNNSQDAQFIKYIDGVIKKNKGVSIKLSQHTLLPICYNQLLEQVIEENIILFPINCIVDFSWLEDLLTELNTLSNPGVACIRPAGTKLTYEAVLQNSFSKGEDAIGLILSLNPKINTVIGFKRSILEQVGKFDTTNKFYGLEVSEWAVRSSVMLFNNFYVRKQACFQLPIKNEWLFPEVTEEKFNNFKESIKAMSKLKNFKK